MRDFIELAVSSDSRRPISRGLVLGVKRVEEVARSLLPAKEKKG